MKQNSGYAGSWTEIVRSLSECIYAGTLFCPPHTLKVVAVITMPHCFHHICMPQRIEFLDIKITYEVMQLLQFFQYYPPSRNILH